MTQHIRYRDDPKILAEQAYSQGFYVEAIQLLHTYLENQAQSLFMLVGSVHFKAEQEDTWDIADSFPFHQCIRALFVLNQITKDEFTEFNKFNSLRNKSYTRSSKRDTNTPTRVFRKMSTTRSSIARLIKLISSPERTKTSLK
jgi:hypothetical protein